MAFAYTVDGEVPIGSRKITFGTFTTTTPTITGTVYTGLVHIDNFTATPKGSAVKTVQNSIDETFPLRVDGVTVLGQTDSVYYWEAIGF